MDLLNITEVSDVNDEGTLFTLQSEIIIKRAYSSISFLNQFQPILKTRSKNILKNM